MRQKAKAIKQQKQTII